MFIQDFKFLKSTQQFLRTENQSVYHGGTEFFTCVTFLLCVLEIFIMYALGPFSQKQSLIRILKTKLCDYKHLSMLNHPVFISTNKYLCVQL